MKSIVVRSLVMSLVLLSLPLFGQQFAVIEAFPNLTFTRPVDLQNSGDGTDRIFVVEQRGVIRVFPNDSNNVAGDVTTFLDISARVDDSQNEEGLLGLAFHPDYANNGYFYVNYTANNPTRSQISRFKVSDTDPDMADDTSELSIITLPKPYWNHNAGAMAFGPFDGYLYITTGDGGSGGDPGNNGQTRSTLLGNILRIDVDNSDPGLAYGIPTDNPFFGNGNGWREEIFAYGLRNPWRMSFDPVTGWLWCADVGQDRYEEVNIIENGSNYGWRVMEANHCFNPSSNCDRTGKTLPIWEYPHSLGISVTGGYVYRGPSVPELFGKYIYGDFVSGRIWSLDYDSSSAPVNALVLDTNLGIASFGVDEANELYICSFNSRLYRFRPSVTTGLGDAAPLAKGYQLAQNYPNPFNPTTHIPFVLAGAARVDLSIFDVNGRLIRSLINRQLPGGEHAVRWDGRGEDRLLQPSGLYFYRLKLDGQVVETRRMMLLK